MRFSAPFLILALSLGIGLAAGCDEDCPDLARQAIIVNLDGVDPGEVTVTARSDDGTPLEDAELGALANLPAGAYDLIFSADGSEIATLADVCTVGPLTGCRAEDAPASDTPVIALSADGSDVEVELTSNGRCP